MTISPTLQRLLTELGPEGAQSLDHLAQALYNVRFTGPVQIHFVGGRPKLLDIGAPMRVRILEGRLDKPESSGSG